MFAFIYLLRALSDGKDSASNTGEAGSIPGSRRSSAEGNGYPFQNSCLETSMDRGAWRAPWGHKKSDFHLCGNCKDFIEVLFEVRDGGRQMVGWDDKG